MEACSASEGKGIRLAVSFAGASGFHATGFPKRNEGICYERRGPNQSDFQNRCRMA